MGRGGPLGRVRAEHGKPSPPAARPSLSGIMIIMADDQ
jgi:hypothetical protein